MGVDVGRERSERLDSPKVEPTKGRPPTSNEKRTRTKSNSPMTIDLSSLAPIVAANTQVNTIKSTSPQPTSPQPNLLQPTTPQPSTTQSGTAQPNTTQPLASQAKSKKQKNQQQVQQNQPQQQQQQEQQQKQKQSKQPPPKPAALHEVVSRDIGQRSLDQTNGPYMCEVTNQLEKVLPNGRPKTPGSPFPQRPQLAGRVLSSNHVLGGESSYAFLPLTSFISNPEVKPKPVKKQINDKTGQTFNLNDFSALYALQSLIERHGRISHMGILDPSYSFFLSTSRDAALYYKIKHKIAVIGGNPLCEAHRYTTFLAEFAAFRKKHHLGIAYLGASEDFAEYAAKQKGWVSMRWGTERALNPMTNEILLEKEGKRIIKQNKASLDAKKGGLQVDIYVPSQQEDLILQAQLKQIYDDWCTARNASGEPQAYMTVFEPFAIPSLMVYVYTTDVKTGKPNGFSALRRIGASGGYHIDPYCATPDAPRGTTDLLIYSSMALLNRAGIPYLGLGFEPAGELSEITGMSTSMRDLTKSAYRRTFSRIPIGGKKAFYDRWHPDPAYDQGLYLIYPDGTPDIRHSLAVMHFSNVSVSRILKAEIREQVEKLQIKARLRDSDEISRDPSPSPAVPTTVVTEAQSDQGTKVNTSPAAQSQETLVPRARSEEIPRPSTSSRKFSGLAIFSRPSKEVASTDNLLQVRTQT